MARKKLGTQPKPIEERRWSRMRTNRPKARIPTIRLRTVRFLSPKEGRR